MMYGTRICNNFLNNTGLKYSISYYWSDTTHVFHRVWAKRDRFLWRLFLIEKNVAVMELRNMSFFVIFVILLIDMLTCLFRSLFAATFLIFSPLNKIFISLWSSFFGFSIWLCWCKICESLMFGLDANFFYLNGFE